MSYIEILILRNLSKRPAHGYELRKRVEAVTGVILNNNSLYPALRRFEEAGAVTRTAHPQQGRPAKLVYELTDVGRELLHDMLADLPPDQADDDVEFTARLGQFGFLSPAERAAVLDARDAALVRRLERLARLRERADNEPWSMLVTAEITARAESEREWLRGLHELAARATAPEVDADRAAGGSAVPRDEPDDGAVGGAIEPSAPGPGPGTR
jgi:DNA-binding PadR family transcriptional regulator